MHCAACVGRVESALSALPEVDSAAVNLASGEVTLKSSSDLAEISDEQLQQAVSQAGYEFAGRVDDGSQFQQVARSDSEQIQLRRRVIVAVPLAVILFALTMFTSDFVGKVWWLLALTTPVVFWCGGPIFASAWKELKQLTANMDTLVAMGAGVAYLVSASAVIFPNVWQGAPPLYFEAAAMIVAFVLVGRWLEARAKRDTYSAIQSLVDLQPTTAVLWNNGEERTVDVRDLQQGDVIRIRPGERIAADGVIHEGTASIDESMVTGESLPVTKSAGDEVIGGTMNESGGLLVQVTKTGNQTVLQQIVTLVKDAQSSKAPIARLADQVASVFVPVVIGIAAVTFIVWWSLDPTANGVSMALMRAVTVLVISCPCALGLATPTAMMAAMGRSAEMGLLVKDAATIETAAKVNCVVFDKTGTLTQGKLSVQAVQAGEQFDSQEMLRFAAAVEQHAEHPLARAIVKQFQTVEEAPPAEESPASLMVMGQNDQKRALPSSNNFNNVAGKGAQAKVGEQRVLVGKVLFMEEQSVDLTSIKNLLNKVEHQPESFVVVAIDGVAWGVITFVDQPKPDAAAAIQQLLRLNIDVQMLSGDRIETAHAIAERLGIKHVIAEVLPANKAEQIEDLNHQGKQVAMIGDGINDAPALAAADVGIAMGSGTDVAINTAGMTLVSSEVSGVPQGLSLARKTMHIVRMNLFFAFIYNIVGIPFAAGVFYPLTGWFLPPMYAAAAMSLSSLSVVTNSLRLKRIPLNGESAES